MNHWTKSVIAWALISLPAMGATVTIEQVLQVSAGSVFPATSTPVPGRAANIVFRGDNPIPPPSINDAGAVVFRARSALNTNTNTSTAFGIYAKSPSNPMIVLVDTTEVSPGVPTFAVPGRPANNRFTSFASPIINNTGDVVFQASFLSPGTTPTSGQGIYATKVTGGPIVRIADTFIPVPAYPTALFNNFLSGLLSVESTIVLNDAGQVAYRGQFLIPGNSTQRFGLFGSSVSGGAGVHLADSVGASGPVSVPIGSNGFFNDIRFALAMNNGGTVAFSAGMPGGVTNRGGVYVVPVTGGPIETVAIRAQAVPGRPGNTFQDTFEPGGHNIDINDSGIVIFRNQYQLSSPLDTGAYSAAPSGAGYVHTRIYDTGPGLTVPGEPAGAEFSGFVLPAVNEAGVVSPFSFVFPGSPTPNQQGIYYTDLDGSPNSVVANLNTAPPGQPAPVGGFPRFTGFIQTNGALGVLNESGNLTFLGSGNPSSGTGFRGVYFYDVCAPELVRISDSTISLSQLGAVVNNGYDIWQVETHAGMYRSINESNDVAFAAQFTNFDYGLYIAHVSTGSGGQLDVICPADVVAECPSDSTTAGAGAASATGCGDITLDFTDSTTAGCGSTENISRTWTANNGSTAASCVQTISEIDTTGPVLFGVPNDASVQCDGFPLPAPPTVTAMDACEGSMDVTLSESQADGACPGTYVLTRTWSAVDGCGNGVSASQDIAVMDNVDPILVGVPADVSAECDAVPMPAEVSASDTCDTSIPVIFVESSAGGDCADAYTLTRSWTAADDCGNDVTANQFITVDDTVAPSITCPPHASVECPGDTSVTATGDASGSDNCGSVTIGLSESSAAGCGQTRTITRAWSATDECSNSSACQQFVSVVDTTPPTLSGVPASGIFECNAVPDAAEVTANDACDADVHVDFSEGRVDGACPQQYVLTRLWAAADDCANSAAAGQTLSVNDTQPPLLACPPDASRECPGDVSIAANGAATATDACGGAAVTSSDAIAGACGATNTVTRTWTATDDCGLHSTCAQTIAVVDTTAPTITVDAAPLTVTDVDCNGTACVMLPAGAANDECQGTTAVSHDAPSCPIATSSYGHHDDDDDGGYGDDDDDGYDDDDDDGGDDDDDGEPPPQTCTNGFCLPVGQSTVTYTATDVCGNVATVQKPVTVKHGANILIRAERHTVPSGTRPHVTKSPLVGIEPCAYDKSYGSCARVVCGGSSHHHYECIATECEPVGCCTTDSQGRCTINVPPGKYIVIAYDETGEELPDPLATSVSDLDCGESKVRYLKQIVHQTGGKKPCKLKRFWGSELLIVEPEFVVWDDTVQEYPFVFETVGDWTVTATVTPPEGFVADYPALTADVDSELESVQFTIEEVGSDLVPTQTAFDIVHKGRRKEFKSSVDILLTPDYAKSRGFNVDELRGKGLIVEPMRNPKPLKRGGSSLRR